jgi:hypothetical protein
MNIPSRKTSTSIVYREVHDEPLVVTLDGKTEVKMQICCTCKLKKPYAAFYVESKSKAKHKGQIRKQCIECWDKYNGKDPNKTSPMTNDLCEFIDNGENDERTILVGGEVSTQDSRRMYST